MRKNPEEAIALISKHNEAALATLDADGFPFNSVVSYLYEPNENLGEVSFLISGLARHTKNLSKQSQASLLILEPGSAYLYERKRVSVKGQATKVEAGNRVYALKAEYLKRFPKAEILFGLADFSFYSMKVEELYYVGGFGSIQTFKP